MPREREEGGVLQPVRPDHADDRLLAADQAVDAAAGAVALERGDGLGRQAVLSREEFLQGLLHLRVIVTNLSGAAVAVWVERPSIVWAERPLIIFELRGNMLYLF